MSRSACAVALLLLLAGAGAPARAATTDILFRDVVHFAAGLGEANRPLVAVIPDIHMSGVVISDPGALVSPGRGCVALGASQAACLAFNAESSGGVIDRVRLELGDGDDELVLEDRFDVRAHAGPGDDRVHTGTGSDKLDGGGGGRDDLASGGGRDALTDGDGEDAPGGTDADLLDGGAGIDVVSYEGRTSGVDVDLADPGTGGAPGEGDRLLGIESARGTRAGDVLRGTEVANRLHGGGGADRIDGRGGHDVITGAGAGKVTCGDGDDTVSGTTPRVLLAPSCERVSRVGDAGGRLAVAAHPDVERGQLTLRIDCPRSGPCAAAAQVLDATGRTVLAAGAVRNAHDELRLPLLLTTTGARRLDRDGTTRVVVRARGQGFGAWAWSVRLATGEA